jgi:GNAT superfamily N-acetyltransferase
VEYHITQYDLEQGALEIQYIEEYFGEFPRKKTAAEIIRRLQGRAHLILLANAPLPDDPGTVTPVSFKVAHEITTSETEPKLVDLVSRLHRHVEFPGRRILYTWIGGTRRDWRGQGHFRALTEQQELWAIEQGFDEIVVKTKNKFYEMRGTLDHLRFEVVKYERHASDNAESKVYLSKKLLPEILDRHRSARTVVQATI